MKKILMTITIAVFAFAPLASAENQKNIVDQVLASESHTTLAKVLEAADLVETLKGEGPFTLFAPSDEAFAQLPEGKLEALLKPENKEGLKALLASHVLPKKLMTFEIVDVPRARTLGGNHVGLKVAGGKVTVGEARVLEPNLIASNGIKHSIDKVILPES
ncbi:MAG: fasciclin domain-containing protein [Verrucomicrobiota bacterium]